jgi:mRNA interferase MazF
MQRGDIYWVLDVNGAGSEFRGNRPGIVVSNDIANKESPVVQMVLLTTRQHHSSLPVRVPVYSTGTLSLACCEQICPVDKQRIGTYIGRCSPLEMHEVDKALMTSLGLQEVKHGR